jgi:hypothetical protein
MKVSEVMLILSEVDPDYDVAIEQIFDNHRSIELRSIEILNKCIIFKDHYVRVSMYSEFLSFDGKIFSVPNFPERLAQR